MASDSDTRPLPAGTAPNPLRTTAGGFKRADDAADEWLRGLSRRGQLAYGLLMGVRFLASAAYLVFLIGQLLPVAAAQEGGGGTGAGDIMCGSGAGEAISLVFSLAALGLLLVAAFRLVDGVNKKGSSRSDKKQEGNEKVKGAAYSFAGVFALIAFPLLLERLGLSTFECVTFAPW
jgi:hypothetical protein